MPKAFVMEKQRTRAQKKAMSFGQRSSTPPTSPPPPTRKPIQVKSSTLDEIDQYWRLRRMIEEDHLLNAEKAAARLRAKALKEEDHRRFEEFLNDVLEENETTKGEKTTSGRNKEPEIGIKDWWTKSKYAYLNQPAIKSMGRTPNQNWTAPPISNRNPAATSLLWNISVPLHLEFIRCSCWARSEEQIMPSPTGLQEG